MKGKEKNEPVRFLLVNSFPYYKLHITLSDFVKFSETVICVE